MNAAPTVVLADDHPPIRLGVRMALLRGGFRVLAEAADGDGAVEAVLRERPDLCLLDISMPGSGGIEAAARLAKLAPATAVVMLTVSASAEDLLAALRAGARGYLPKDMSPDRLPAALRGVLKGEAALPRTFVARMLHEMRELPAPGHAPVRVRRRRAHRAGVRDPAHVALRPLHLGDRRAPLALPRHRPPPPLRRRFQARRRRARRGLARDRVAALGGSGSWPGAEPATADAGHGGPAPTRVVGAPTRVDDPPDHPLVRPGPPAPRTPRPVRGCAPRAFRRCWSRTA